jgi:hypothetical protein
VPHRSIPFASADAPYEVGISSQDTIVVIHSPFTASEFFLRETAAGQAGGGKGGRSIGSTLSLTRARGTGRALFLYTQARAGGLIEEQQWSGSNFSFMTETERAEMLRRYGWELLVPSPL